MKIVKTLLSSLLLMLAANIYAANVAEEGPSVQGIELNLILGVDARYIPQSEFPIRVEFEPHQINCMNRMPVAASTEINFPMFVSLPSQRIEKRNIGLSCFGTDAQIWLVIKVIKATGAEEYSTVLVFRQRGAWWDGSFSQKEEVHSIYFSKTRCPGNVADCENTGMLPVNHGDSIYLYTALE